MINNKAVKKLVAKKIDLIAKDFADKLQDSGKVNSVVGSIEEAKKLCEFYHLRFIKAQDMRMLFWKLPQDQNMIVNYKVSSEVESLIKSLLLDLYEEIYLTDHQVIKIMSMKLFKISYLLENMESLIAPLAVEA